MTKESTLDKAARMAMESVVQEIKMTDKYAKLQDHVGKYVAVPLHDIRIEDNVRQTVNFESTRFEELVDSIRAHGLLQNPVVELRVEEGIHILNCVAGQRRILAAIKAGLKTGTCQGMKAGDEWNREGIGEWRLLADEWQQLQERGASPARLNSPKVVQSAATSFTSLPLPTR